MQATHGDEIEKRLCARELHLVMSMVLLAVLCRLGMLRLCHSHEFFSSWYGSVSGNRRRAATSQRSASCFVIALATSVGVRVLTHEHGCHRREMIQWLHLTQAGAPMHFIPFRPYAAEPSQCIGLDLCTSTASPLNPAPHTNKHAAYHRRTKCSRKPPPAPALRCRTPSGNC